MIQEYKYAKGWSILTYVIGPVLILGFGSIAVFAATSTGMDSILRMVLIPVMMFLCLIAFISIFSVMKSRVIIDDASITVKGLFKTRKLLISEIDGYLYNRNDIHLIPLTPEKDKLVVSQYFERRESLLAWIEAHSEDLDVRQIRQEQEAILANEEFGDTEQQRSDFLKTARWTVRLLNIVATPLSIMLLFYPEPYQILNMAAFFFWVPTLLILIYFKGLVVIEAKKDSRLPSVFYTLMFPALCLVLRTMMDYDIPDYSVIWPKLIAPVAISFALFILFTKEIRLKSGEELLRSVFILLILLSYFYGGTVHYNCFYDQSDPVIYRAEIIEKRINDGKYTSYYINLKPWGPIREFNERKVSEKLFDKLQVGDQVKISYYQGRLGIPWLWVGQE